MIGVLVSVARSRCWFAYMVVYEYISLMILRWVGSGNEAYEGENQCMSSCSPGISFWNWKRGSPFRSDIISVAEMFGLLGVHHSHWHVSKYCTEVASTSRQWCTTLHSLIPCMRTSMQFFFEKGYIVCPAFCLTQTVVSTYFQLLCWWLSYVGAAKVVAQSCRSLQSLNGRA